MSLIDEALKCDAGHMLMQDGRQAPDGSLVFVSVKQAEGQPPGRIQAVAEAMQRAMNELYLSVVV